MFSGHRGSLVLRFLLLNAFIGLFSILMCFWSLLLAVFDRGGRLIHFYAAVPWARAILRVCGVHVTAVGKDGVAPHIPRIYMTNHQSYFDILALLAHLPVDFKFIMKQELMNIPLLGMAMKRAGYIGIEREDPRKAVRSMNAAAERIRAGSSVLIFPEGTRSLDGSLQPFKKGGFNLAFKAGCDIVPITIVGSRRIVPKGSLRIRKGRFSMIIGDPVPVKWYRKKDTGRLMEEIRAVMLRQMEQGKRAKDS